MNYIDILDKIKANKGIDKYVVIDTRIVGGNSNSGDIIKINLKKVKGSKIEYKEMFVLPTFDWGYDAYKEAGISEKRLKSGKKFASVYSDLINFVGDYVLVSNQASAIKKTFSKNCKRAAIAVSLFKWLDGFFVCRLTYPKNDAASIGGFATFLKISYSTTDIAKDFNICNLIDSVFKSTIKTAIKINAKPMPFVDYERSRSEAQIRIISRVVIILMLISLIIFMFIML